jgi:hypothetical protein
MREKRWRNVEDEVCVIGCGFAMFEENKTRITEKTLIQGQDIWERERTSTN